MKIRIKDILKLEPKSQTVTAYGWIRTKRESKTFCFLEINDGSTIKNLQIILDSSAAGYKDLILKLTTGTSIKTSGKVVVSPGKEQNIELHADTIHIYGGADPDEYPLQKKRHSFEFLREIAHLRPRTNTIGAVTRVRNKMSYAIHKFFQERNFLYINTPIITASDCEGAGEMFQVTTLPLDNMPADKKPDYTNDFFGKKAFLTVSGQLEGEIYASALGDIYTFGPTFRAEHSNTKRHLSEFWMIEPEIAFCDINGNMDIAEEFIKYIFVYILENCKDDIDFFNNRIDKYIINTVIHDIDLDFVRIT